MQWETASLFWFVRNLEMAPSGRVTPHSVGRCRASDRGARLRSSPAKRVGERAYNKVRDREIVSPSVRFADSAPLLALRATSPVPGESVSQREPLLYSTTY